MDARRELQVKIDGVLWEVMEGLDALDSLCNKFYDTENRGLKGRYEADLTTEIKKLQRHRDQIKTWIRSDHGHVINNTVKRALLDAHEQIKREMERYKDGLGQQPRTDPREKAKAETRDWLNNVIRELKSQIYLFEGELEVSYDKRKPRHPRLVHLEKSIARHKAHIKILESILRFLDNDELSPEQLNDVKYFLEDYVERNQEDSHEFSDVEVEDLYSTLRMEKVDGPENMVSLAPSSLIKGVATLSTTAVLSTNSSATTSSTQEDFYEFSNVEDLYRTLRLKKAEAPDDMISLASSNLIKGVAAVSTQVHAIQN